MRKVPVYAWLFSITVAGMFTKTGKQMSQGLESNQRHSEVYKLVMTSGSSFCRYGRLPEYESYYITAESNREIICKLFFTDMDKMLVRIGAPIDKDEIIHLYGKEYNITLTHVDPLYACYLLYGAGTVEYRKKANVRPSVNLVITDAECADYDEDCDQSCRVDTCLKPLPIHGCRRVCIDEDLTCDRYQQCPYGEDEYCGHITTVTPMPDCNPSTPVTTARPDTTASASRTSATSSSPVSTPNETVTTTLPPHIFLLPMGPNRDGCRGDVKRYSNKEMVITGSYGSHWTGQCEYVFYSTHHRRDDDREDLTVLRLEGVLSTAESIRLSGGNGEFLLNHRADSGDCVITTGSFKMSYSIDGFTASPWRLVSTPIDCDPDDDCGQHCSTKRCIEASRMCPRSGCIRSINICDGIQQCPYGEDESCGLISTVIPARRKLNSGEIFLISLAVVVVVASAIGTVSYLMERSKKRKEAAFEMLRPVQMETPGHEGSLRGQFGKKEELKQDDEHLYETT